MYPYRTPLRYQISNWKQLPNCKSNNSKQLHLHVTDFIQNNDINGVRITLDHEIYGELFSYVVNASGSLVSTFDKDIEYELTTDEILTQLAKYGFLITFHSWEDLSGDQVQYLMTLQNLHFDKIRLLSVWDAPNGVKEFKLHVVAFQVEQLPDWLNAGYAPSKTEFLDALNSGYAINISAISETRNYRWDWLYNWVADIGDVLADNAKLC